jgi:2-methylcitrate dehydratase PrpD
LYNAAPMISDALAAFAASLTPARVPEEVRRRARHLVLDAAGCAAGARRFDFAAASLAGIAELAGEGRRAVIGERRRLPLRDAVLANGLLVHGLDYDDTHSEGIVHLTASVFPAALGVAAELDASGEALLLAYVAGVEAGARLASVAQGGFHQAGFHPTGLVGAFACAIAAAKLYGLTAEQCVHAQGVALSLASGSLEFLEDGAWTKRLHPGWAGVGGITAAALARRGFVAPRAAYEGRHGLFRLFLKEQRDLARATRGLNQTWETLNVAVKPFPACHFVHAFADAALALRRGGADPARIERITALVPREVVDVVCEPAANKRRPANDYDARFSVPYAIAASLVAGRFGLEELAPAALRDSRILELAGKVGYDIDPHSGFPAHYSGEVVLHLAGGAVLRHREAVNRGSADRPLADAEIEAKFFDNGGARAVRDAVLGMERLSARELEKVLGG